MQVTIVGGGLTGLAAAYYLGHARRDWTIRLYEQAGRLGGKIHTKRAGNFVVELGPDSYLARKTEMTDLICELGLGDTLTANATGHAYVYDRHAVHPIPGGSIMGIPTEMMPFVKATLISWPGKLRAGLDYFKKPYPLDENGDVSIGHFFRYHLGQEMMDKLIEPLLAGIYGGDIYKISLLSTFPHFIQVEQKYGNMVKGMMAAKRSHRQAGVSRGAQGVSNEGDMPHAGKGAVTDADFEKRKGTASQSGMFRQLTGGLESVIDAIADHMPPNVSMYTNAPVQDIERVDGQYILTVDRLGVSSSERPDILIITTPPAAYRQWFYSDEGFDPLRHMEQSSCAIAVMAFDRSDFDGELPGSGLLITRKTDTPLTACTILNQKWPQSVPDDKIVLRVFIGKPGNDAVERYDKVHLKELAVEEIQRIMKFKARPEWVEINRLIHCMPQYNVGHRAGIDAVREHVAKHYPGLYLIGTPFDGIGIPDGVRQAKELAEHIAEHIKE